ncbi:hypothetical protein TrCOL_g7143, partial [Triparma columacea]
KSPSLTMRECASVVRSCVTGRVKVNTLTMGNVDEGEVWRIMEGVRDDVLGEQEGKPELNDNELPQFRSMQDMELGIVLTLTYVPILVTLANLVCKLRTLPTIVENVFEDWRRFGIGECDGVKCSVHFVA